MIRWLHPEKGHYVTEDGRGMVTRIAAHEWTGLFNRQPVIYGAHSAREARMHVEIAMRTEEQG